MSTAPTTVAVDVASDVAARRARRVTSIDRGAYVGFVALSLVGLVLVILITAFVIYEAWPSFAANGLSWFTDGPTPLDVQLSAAFTDANTSLRAWPAIYGTLLTTGGALLIASPSRPRRDLRGRARTGLDGAIIEPTCRLLAGTPSVSSASFAILELAPWIDDHLISQEHGRQAGARRDDHGGQRAARDHRLDRHDRADHDRDLHRRPAGGADGVDARARSRSAATVGARLAASRWSRSGPPSWPAPASPSGAPIGEAIALSMASGSLGFTPNPLDGLWFFVEPARPLAAAIVDYSEGFDQAAAAADLFAFGAMLLVSTAALTLAARLVSIRSSAGSRAVPRRASDSIGSCSPGSPGSCWSPPWLRACSGCASAASGTSTGRSCTTAVAGLAREGRRRAASSTRSPAR